MTRHRDDIDGLSDSARADDTPTHPAPIEVLGAQLDAFRRDPTDADAFAELRTRLRNGGNGELLADPRRRAVGRGR